MLRYHALVALLVVVACVIAVAKADEDDDEPLVDVPEPVDEDQVLPRESGDFFFPPPRYCAHFIHHFRNLGQRNGKLLFTPAPSLLSVWEYYPTIDIPGSRNPVPGY